MKKLFAFLITILYIVLFVDRYALNNKIYNYVKSFHDNNEYSIVTNMEALEKSNYVYNNYSSYVKLLDNFTVTNKNDLLNVYYTVLNNGWDNFSFYCDLSYTKCFDDINDLSNNSDVFSSVNQLVHPFNSFKTIKSNYNSNNRVDISITKKYSADDIEKINNKINEIINELNINNYTNSKDKIKTFHDYIANANKYDIDRQDKKYKYHSDSAIGTLFEGYSICSGYTDTMAIFLSKINIENIRIANNNHTWNAVKLNNNWYHIDLTWDDPVTSNGSDVINYDYFLINTYELNNRYDKEHTFDKEIYDFIY